MNDSNRSGHLQSDGRLVAAIARVLSESRHNLVYATRTLGRSPAFVVAVVLTLSLCIGANTAILALVDSALLRPLPYPDPEELAVIVRESPSLESSNPRSNIDGQTWEALQRHADFLELAVMIPATRGVNLRVEEGPLYAQQQRVSKGYFELLGIPLIRGRGFTAQEDRPGGSDVVVLSHRLWNELFLGAPGVLGASVRLGGRPHTVVGITSPDFRGLADADLWIPCRASASGEGGGANYTAIARISDGLSWEVALQRLEALSPEALGHLSSFASGDARLQAKPLKWDLVKSVRIPILLIWGAVIVVLLIGCLNLAGLVIARGAASAGETATRRALGASRASVFRLAFMESLLLTFAGGLGGALLGATGTRVIERIAGAYLGFAEALRVDWRFVLGAASLSLVATATLGILPAAQASKVDPARALEGRSHRGATGRRRQWQLRTLVLGEIALGVVLLVGGGLLLRTLHHFDALSRSFEPEGLVAAKVSLEGERYSDPGTVASLFQESLAKIAALPSVDEAAVVLSLPYERWLNLDFTALDEVTPPDRIQLTDLNYVTPEALGVLRLSLRSGRTFTDQDRRGAEPVAIVSQSFASRYSKNRPIIGRRFSFSGTEHSVVGVVDDLPRVSGWGNAAPLASQPAAFVPVAQLPSSFFELVHGWFSPSWILRVNGEVAGLPEQVARAIQSVDTDLPLASFSSVTTLRNRALGHQRILAMLLGSLGILAIILAAVGIYGLIAGVIESRRRELGIRMALGASVPKTITTVTAPILGLAAAGVAIGCGLALLMVRGLRSLVWGVELNDPKTLVAVSLFFLLVSLAAVLVPTAQLARLNPSQALRRESL